MCADVVIIGGGPVGCWTAIQIKKRDPSLDVQIYERREQYQRDHVIRLRHLSMLLYSKTDSDQHQHAFIKKVTGYDGLRGVYGAAARGGNVTIKTNDLEKALKEYCTDIGIKIDYKTIDTPDDLMNAHPECNTFIAADGANSRMRTNILGPDGVTSRDVLPTFEVKYQSRPGARPLDGILDMFKTANLTDFIVSEYVGNESNGTVPVTLRFVIDQETYEAIPASSYENPLKLDDGRLPEKLARDVRAYMNLRATDANDQCVQGSVQLTKIMMSAQIAKKFAALHKSRNDGREAAWFFVGDAAQALPFFRALNSGIVNGSQLSMILTSPRLSQESKVRLFNAARPAHVIWEQGAMVATSAAIKVYEKVRPLLRYLPFGKTPGGL